jgi:uncharacterized protein YabE (DUF348 family)
MQFFIGNKPYLNSLVKRASALAVMIIITVSTLATVAAATCNANINYNGEKKSIQLFSRNTDDILKAAGYKTGAQDLVIRNEAQTPGGDVNITVKSAYQVNVKADGSVKTVTVYYGDTVADAVKASGFTPSANDAVTPSVDTKATNGLNIDISRKFNVTVVADGQTKTAVVTEGSVEKALGQAGVTVGGEDVISADKAAPASEGMKLTVNRVTYQEVTKTESIAYQSKEVNDNTLRKGTKKVQTAGVNGSKAIVMRQKLIDGKVAGTEVVKTTVVKQPVNQVTRVGTKKIASAFATVNSDGTLVDQNGNTVNFKKYITGRCSGYTGGGRTSTGRAAAVGLVAVNPSVIPYGSKLYICSADGKTVYGYAIAADTGGGLMSGRIVADLYFNSASQCRQFGVRNMRIYIL